jgi:hypothetical protein
MPGHFTHVYTARRIGELLSTGDPAPGWPGVPGASDGVPEGWTDASTLGAVMQKWEKFAALGAVGPDLFYFSQDYNGLPLGPQSDELMLMLAIYYYFDYAKEHDWEPLLLILQEVDATFANVIRFLIKLQKAWESFKQAWDNTIGPFVDAADSLLDDLTGGVISQFQVALDELVDALKLVGEQELFTWADIFTRFDTCVAKGLDEQSFLWSDMSHYRRTSELARNLWRRTEIPGALDDTGQDWPTAGGEDPPECDDPDDRTGQFQAFALGWMTHLGIDTAAHPFVNEQAGGPFRLHPQRHHLIENHIDAWHYRQAGATDPHSLITDEIASNDAFPDLSNSAFWFALQFTPDNPCGYPRPDDPADTDKDGVMPMWMADAIVQAMIDTFAEGKGHPAEGERWTQPRIYKGSAFQDTIDEAKLFDLIFQITGQPADRPFSELLEAIAPTPPFEVPEGFPLPWQIRTVYFFLNTFFKLSFSGGFELDKPRHPDVVILPPSQDVEDLLQPPDFDGPSSGDPVEDACNDIKSFFDWLWHEAQAASKLAGDLIKALTSPGTYPVRLALYELAMLAWDIVTRSHEILVHTGFLLPHGEQRYEDGELRLPNEIDLPLITLGGTVDATFQQALGDAIDPFGNLDTNQGLPQAHDVADPRYPYYTVLQMDENRVVEVPADPQEFRRPWAYPYDSPAPKDPDYGGTPTELYDATKPGGDDQADGTPLPDAMHLRPGPYPEGSLPDQVLFRTGDEVDPEVRARYEQARTPRETDWLNLNHLLQQGRPTAPLGDPIPLSIYLIGRLANPTGFTTQFNLDSDRAYGYLTWDWIRSQTATDTNDGVLVGDGGPLGLPGPVTFRAPEVWPLLSEQWPGPTVRMQLEYVDPPAPLLGLADLSHLDRAAPAPAPRRRAPRTPAPPKRAGAKTTRKRGAR